MTAISDEARAMFKRALARHDEINKLQTEAGRDASKLHKELVGKRILKLSKRYQIDSVENGWDGTVKARGRRVRANGKLGSQVWDIGFLNTNHFDDEAA